MSELELKNETLQIVWKTNKAGTLTMTIPKPIAVNLNIQAKSKIRVYEIAGTMVVTKA